MTNELKEETMTIVLSQLIAEVAEDRHMIDLILEDPSVVTHEKSVAYTIHEKMHHIAIHERAIEETKKLIYQIKTQ